MSKPVETCLLTDGEQYRLIDNFIYDNYEVYGTINLSDDDQTVFEVEFRPPDEKCRGVVRLTGDCEVVRHEKFHCAWTGWTQKEAQEREREARERKRKENLYHNIDTAIRTHFRALDASNPWRDLPWEVVNIEPNRILDIKLEPYVYTFKVTGVEHIEPGFTRLCTVDVLIVVGNGDRVSRVREKPATYECRYRRAE